MRPMVIAFIAGTSILGTAWAARAVPFCSSRHDFWQMREIAGDHLPPNNSIPGGWMLRP